MYVSPNFASKKALKEAIAAGVSIELFRPNDIFGKPIPTDGKVFIEGPHYPKPHKWYAEGKVVAGKLVSVK